MRRIWYNNNRLKAGERCIENVIDEVELPPKASTALIERGIAIVRKVLDDFVRAALMCDSEEVHVGESCDVVCEEMVLRRARPKRICRAASAPPGFAPEPPRPPNLKAPVLSFSARLLTYVNEKCDGKGVLAYRRAGVKKQIYSRIISSDMAGAKKQTVMQFCIGLKLSVVEAERLMKSAGYAFSGSIPLDRAFTYCLENEIYNIRDVEAILIANDLPSLKLNL